MNEEKTDIINQLRKDILFLQGFKPGLAGTAPDILPVPVKVAFPGNVFPLGAVHEFLCAETEDGAATGGFVSGLLSTLMRNSGASLWVSSCRTIFPPGLKAFGINPERIIFVDLQKEKDVLWAMEEGLKCGGLSAVVGEMQEMSFTASRRLQLAVEQSKVTGFILRHHPRKVNVTACVTRWKIKPIQSVPEDDMPGIGYPRWKVELLKVRNGTPGTWEIEWVAGRFRIVHKRITTMPVKLISKTG